MPSQSTRKFCGHSSDVPKEDHFAILEFFTIHTPGDERSRTHPGHGYPASDDPASRYIAYTDRAEWEAEVSKNAQRQDASRYLALVVKVPRIELKTTISIG